MNHSSMLSFTAFCPLLLCAAVSFEPKNSDAPAIESYKPARHTLPDPPPALSVTRTYRRSLSGDFNLDRVRDILQVVEMSAGPGGPTTRAAQVWFSPGEFDAMVNLGASATFWDVEVKRNIGSADDLFYVDASGLRLEQYDSVARAFTHPSGSASTSTAWQGARMIRDADPRSASTTGLIGVGSSGRRLLYGATAANGWQPATLDLSNSETIVDIAGLNWDGHAGNEIAVATVTSSTSCVRVFDASGNALGAFESGVPGWIRFTPLRQAAQNDRLACVLDIPVVNAQLLAVLSASPTGAPVFGDSLQLGALDACAITSADEDNDGDEDLYLSTRMAHVLMFLKNVRQPAVPGLENLPSFTPTPTPTDPDPYWYYELLETASTTTPALDNQASATVTDLDNDGYVDMFQAVQSRSEGLVIRNLHVTPELRPVPTVLYGDLGSSTYSFAFDPANAALSGLPIQQRPTHLEVDTWYADGAITLPTQTTALDMPVLEISLTNHAQVSGLGAHQVDLSYTNPLPNDPTGFLGVRMRYVQRNAGSGALERVWPSYVGILTNRDQELAALLSLYPNSPFMTPPTDPENGGGFVPRPKIGPFKKVVPGTPPQVIPGGLPIQSL
jgi:hypothetical protein